mmetsp:Transcript_22550/g.76239  ORF Transcript_22550/g.76239 Transcript_22550/m.76239 type:complete len:460 (-) Transcript_22550:88-1467(-)
MSGGTATPLPMAKIAVLVLVFLGDALCMSVVLPFVPFMVQRFMQFGPGEEHLVGYYAGAIAAAYITGQLCTAALWGALSDRVGRRPVMLLCLALSVACVLAFGAAPNLPFALVVRFAHGLVSGNVVVAKTMLADLTDSTNEAAAFVYVGVTFGAGAILGPLIGGTLSESADKYCALPLAWLWVARPYLLPCAVVAAVVLLDLAFAFFYLEESIETRSDARSESRPRAAGGAKGATAGAVRGEVDNVADLLRDPKSPFFRVCCSFFLFGGCFMSFQEVFPIFARAPLHEGGLSLSSTQVGLAQATAGMATLFCVVLLYPVLARHLGVPRTYAAALAACVLVAYAAPPFIAAYAAMPGHEIPWAALLFANGIVSVATEISFTSLNIMLKNAAPPSSPLVSLPAALRAGRLYFVVLEFVAILNILIILGLPKWPWRDRHQAEYHAAASDEIVELELNDTAGP